MLKLLTQNEWAHCCHACLRHAFFCAPLTVDECYVIICGAKRIYSILNDCVNVIQLLVRNLPAFFFFKKKVSSFFYGIILKDWDTHKLIYRTLCIYNPLYYNLVKAGHYGTREIIRTTETCRSLTPKRWSVPRQSLVKCLPPTPSDSLINASWAQLLPLGYRRVVCLCVMFMRAKFHILGIQR